MLTINRFYLICTFLCVTILGNSQIRKADSLMLVSDYEASYLAYEYELFINPETPDYNKIRLQQALAQKYLTNYQKSAELLGQVRLFRATDSLRFRVNYELMLLNYMMEEYNAAASYSTKMQAHGDRGQLDATLFIQVVVYLYAEDYSKSQNKLSAYIQNQNLSQHRQDSLVNKMNSLFAQIPELKSTRKAELLSTFVPGSGQFYAGHRLEGVLNLTLHVAFLAYGGWQFYQKFYATGYFVGLGLFQKFYFGGLKRANHLTRLYNKSQKEHFNHLVINFMDEIEVFRSH